MPIQSQYPTPSPADHDARAEANEALRERWEDEFNHSSTADKIADLLGDYLLDNFRELRPWKNLLPNVLSRMFDAKGTDDELATLGEVFGECVSWQTFLCSNTTTNDDPFNSDDPRVP